MALRGDEEARAVKALVGQLRERAEDLAQKHGDDLVRLAEATVEAEKAWRQAETDAGTAFSEELIARVGLVRQLQKNEGALITIFPGQRRRVRSFFRPTRRRAAAPDTGEPEPTE